LAQVVDADVFLIFPAEKILVGRWWWSVPLPHVTENRRYLRALAQVVDADVFLIFPAEKILVGRWWRG
jgi:hypothetical protein